MTSPTIIDSFELKLKACVREVPGKRRVFKALWNGKEAFVKVFEHKSSAERHFKRELQGLKAFEERLIKTPKLLWSGQSPVIPTFKIDNNAYLIITEALPDCQEFLDAYQINKVSLLKKLFNCIETHHKGNLLQKDLHPGNFLISQGDLYSLDGDAVAQTQDELSIDQRSENLALLIAQFPVGDEELIMTALSSYDLSYSQLKEKLKDARSRRCKKYLNKVYRQCTEIELTHSGALLKREFSSVDMKTFLTNPGAHITSNPEKLLKNGNTATVAEVKIGESSYVIKRNNYNKNFKTFTRRFRESRASISWRNAFRLINYGFKTPAPVALKIDKVGPAVKNAYFICLKAEGPDALEYLKRNHDEDVIDGFVEIFKGFEKCMITHGDCKATNFIISSGEILIIDLDAMKEHRDESKFSKSFKKDIKRWLANWQDDNKLLETFRDKLTEAGLGKYLPS